MQKKTCITSSDYVSPYLKAGSYDTAGRPPKVTVKFFFSRLRSWCTYSWARRSCLTFLRRHVPANRRTARLWLQPTRSNVSTRKVRLGAGPDRSASPMLPSWSGWLSSNWPRSTTSSVNEVRTMNNWEISHGKPQDFSHQITTSISFVKHCLQLINWLITMQYLKTWKFTSAIVLFIFRYFHW